MTLYRWSVLGLRFGLLILSFSPMDLSFSEWRVTLYRWSVLGLRFGLLILSFSPMDLSFSE